MALVGPGLGLARGPLFDDGQHALVHFEESVSGDWFFKGRDDLLVADGGIADCDRVFECRVRWHASFVCGCALRALMVCF